MLKNRLWANPFVVFLVAAGLVSGVIPVWYFLGDHPVTTVILVRHAEKNIEPDNPNPALSPAGLERAQTLVHTLGSSGIAAIYATQYTAPNPRQRRLLITRDLTSIKDLETAGFGQAD